MPSPEARLVAVVEDESTIREAISAALAKEGYLVESFSDGMRAWEAFARKLPDLAILDIGVPRIDGLEICRRLRGLSDTIPIIFVTSREEEFDRVLGLELGADDYLCKPFSMRELMARVKVLFRRASAASTDVRHDDERPSIVGDSNAGPASAGRDMEGCAGTTHRHRVPVAPIAGTQTWHRQDTRAVDGGHVSGCRVGHRSNDRQSREADSTQIRIGGSRLLSARERVWGRVSLRRTA